MATGILGRAVVYGVMLNNRNCAFTPMVVLLCVCVWVGDVHVLFGGKSSTVGSLLNQLTSFERSCLVLGLFGIRG